MDFCRNVSVPGEYPQEKALPPADFSMYNGAYSASSSLDDLFPNTQGDVSLEWLSAFVEDCLSSTGNCLPVPTNPAPSQEPPQQEGILQSTKPFDEKPQRTPPSLHLQEFEFSVPGKARTKRKRVPSTKTHSFTCSDPPLLHQPHWLADSELMVPKKPSHGERGEEEEKILGSSDNNNANMGQGQVQGRRCTHCLSQKTPQWRAGPLGPKTLCNACGVRFKSGRLLPEYRPAKSPTFVSYKHSNSHKKVMEMRMSVCTE